MNPSMRSRPTCWTATAGLFLLLAACATREPRCDGALRPINSAAPGSPVTSVATSPR